MRNFFSALQSRLHFVVAPSFSLRLVKFPSFFFLLFFFLSDHFLYHLPCHDFYVSHESPSVLIRPTFFWVCG
ncbi:hypothetical protein GLYMA_12G169000v4 [Glycine max]|uniref:Uncharacterized protein n=1 Tax=Glycine max TaxID=3847 RepID=K7LVE5_SOYBN|nr:hypothetical protein GYH30_034010 [Glycine max]KRH26352.1 hypothetical protein GLYMA_12G169000v4 [Glycine max]